MQEHEFLPPHHLAAKYQSTSLRFGQEYKSIRKQLAATANVLFSIGGAGAAVFLVAKTSAGYSSEVVGSHFPFFQVYNNSQS